MTEQPAPGAAKPRRAKLLQPNPLRSNPPRTERDGAPQPGTRKPALSTPRRLAAEVARLEAELAALRSQVVELTASAERDPLTDLLNRRGFARELGRTIAYLARYPACAALIYLDLDRFKPVNDLHGHAAGDLVLQAVAGTLGSHVRASDSVARLGGDEFAVLLWNLSEQDARAKARALEQEIARTTVGWNGLALSVSASAGVALLTATDTAADVLARADAAMYARKGQQARENAQARRDAQTR